MADIEVCGPAMSTNSMTVCCELSTNRFHRHPSKNLDSSFRGSERWMGRKYAARLQHTIQPQSLVVKAYPGISLSSGGRVLATKDPTANSGA